MLSHITKISLALFASVFLIPSVNGAACSDAKTCLVLYLDKYLKSNTNGDVGATYGLIGNLINVLNTQEKASQASSSSITQGVINKFVSTTDTGYRSGLMSSQLNISPNQVTAGGGGGPFGGISGGGSVPNDNSALNIDTLLDTMRMGTIDNATTAEKTKYVAATNFIIVATGAGNVEPLKPKSSIPDTNKRNKYYLTQWSMTTKQAAAIATLNHLLEERKLVEDLGTSAGYKKLTTPFLAIPDASPAELEQYLVQKRSGNPSWYAQMEQEPPLSIERESLYVLADIQRLLYKNRQINERIEALQALQLAGAVEMARALDDLAEKISPPA